MKIRSKRLITITPAMLAAVSVPVPALAFCLNVGNGALTVNHRVGR